MLHSESQRPGFSVRGQKPLRMVGLESHDAESAGKKEQNLYKTSIEIINLLILSSWHY